ncbi:BrnT family toxin [Massilia sp. 9096]|uniref:BrnT family toxin n=1 Tax=Massilia sp. 9096 TaxID=1500894 RepID=UPI00055B2841|nr:BrnT family toxin [Massilia sp. 9096]
MQITFDHAKDQINVEKHDVSLSATADFEWDDALVSVDERRNYGEARMIAIGYIGERLYVVVYVDRHDSRRIISLRKANSREARYYAEA